MKKLLLLSLALFLGPICLHAQNPVPNPSFENWTQGNPDNWLTTNVIGVIVPVTQVTPGHTGTYALKGEVVSFSGTNFPPVIFSSQSTGGNGFPITQSYTNLRFYYKLVFSNPGDELDAIALLQDASGNSVAVGGGVYDQATSVFTQANVPITYSGTNPDTAIIEFTMGNSIGGTPAVGSYFIIDDVELNFASGIVENTTTGIGTIYPNPSGTVINIPFHQTTAERISISIYDMKGCLLRNILNENPGIGEFKIVEDISHLEDGLYQIVMRTNTGVYSMPFQVCH